MVVGNAGGSLDAEESLPPEPDSTWKNSHAYRRTQWVSWAIGVVAVCLILGLSSYQYLQFQAEMSEWDSRYEKVRAAESQVDDAETMYGLARVSLETKRQLLEDAIRSGTSSSQANLEQLQSAIADAERVVQLTASEEAALSEQASSARADLVEYEAEVGPPFSRLLITGVVVLITLLVSALIIFAIRSERRRVWENRRLLSDLKPPDLAYSSDTRWRHNEEQLQHYHRLVQNYSASTRQLTIIVIMSQFAFLLAVGAAFLLISNTSTAIAASVVAAVFAGVTGFVSNVVLRNAEASAQEVRQFFRHPLDVQRLLSAQRIVDEMQETEKDKARMVIVQSLTLPPGATEASAVTGGSTAP